MTEFLNRVAVYGADMDGITGRFCGDMGLYEECLRDFFDRPEPAELDEAIRSGDYAGATLPAHTIKGLSGNLGLTLLYKKAAAPVVARHASECANAPQLYDEMRRETDTRKELL